MELLSFGKHLHFELDNESNAGGHLGRVGLFVACGIRTKV
jgi:hypothetical protein